MSDDASRRSQAGQHKRPSPDQSGQQPSPDQLDDQNRHEEAPAKEIPKDQPGYDQNETGDRSA